jgi:hypothetical protein
MPKPSFPLTPDLFNEAIPMIPVRDLEHLDEFRAMQEALGHFQMHPETMEVRTIEEKEGFPVFRQSFAHWNGFFWSGRPEGWVEGEAFALNQTKLSMEKRWAADYVGEPLPEVTWVIEEKKGPFARALVMPWPATTEWTWAMIELLPVLGQARMEQENLGKNLPESQPGKPVFRL